MKKLLLSLSVALLMNSTFVMAQDEVETVYHYEENDNGDLGVVGIDVNVLKDANGFKMETK